MEEAELNWEFIKAQLPAGWRELAVERELIRPQPPQLRTKVTDIEQVLRPLLLRVSWGTSLVTTMGTIALAKAAVEGNGTGTADPGAPAQVGGEPHGAAMPSNSLVAMSAVALHKWERKLGPYLATLLARMLDSKSTFSALQWSGYDIVLADGTTVTRPGAQGTTARVLYALHLEDMTLLQCFVTDEHGSERLRAFEVHPGQLWIGDRAYCNPPDLAWVVDAGAALMVRYNRGTLPLYDAKGQPFDVLSHVRALRDPDAMAEWRVWVHPQRHTPIRGRLCAVRLPEEKIEAARERLRREQGGKVTAESLEAAAWVMVFTTVSRRRIHTESVLALYRVRWQMELEIKREKSLGGLDKLPNFLPETIAAWLQAKLLIQQIARKIVSPSVAFPPCAAVVVPVARSPQRGAAAVVSVAHSSQRGAAAVVPASRSDPREAAPARASDRRPNVARHGARLPDHPRRTATHIAA
ncbi:MAG: hypothetical protein RL033_4614 [Pseudomonadota bacterium]